MWHLSDYGLQQAAQREQLLSQLVARLTGLREGDRDHEAALDGALHALQRHKGLDVNPKEVEDTYRRWAGAGRVGSRAGRRGGSWQGSDSCRCCILVQAHAPAVPIQSRQVYPQLEAGPAHPPRCPPQAARPAGRVCAVGEAAGAGAAGGAAAAPPRPGVQPA